MNRTTISWTDATWNPVRGCSRVSRGCEHCYAEGVARRFSGPGQPYEGLVRLDREGRAKAQWNGVVRMVLEHLGDPLRWTKPRRVFVNSMSDLFHEALPITDIALVFAVMAHAKQHTFQVLTKRPSRMREILASELFWVDVDSESSNVCVEHDLPEAERDRVANLCGARVLPNVWLGVSVEDQATADERIPHLLACPASVRFVSYEPALGPVDFERLTGRDGIYTDALAEHHHLDWVIVGGESGPGARPFDLAWARSVVTQCHEAGTKCFVKQLGADPRGNGHDVRPMRVNDDGTPAPSGLRECRLHLRDRKGGDMSEWPEDLRVREFPNTKDTQR